MQIQEWQSYSLDDRAMVYRLNRVPDKTYIPFPTFIGEDRKSAQPHCFDILCSSGRPLEVAAFSSAPPSRVKTRQHLIYNNQHAHDPRFDDWADDGCKGGDEPLVRELPFALLDNNPSVITFDQARGVAIFDIDPVDYGPDHTLQSSTYMLATKIFERWTLNLSIENPSGLSVCWVEKMRSVLLSSFWLGIPDRFCLLSCELDRHDDERGNVKDYFAFSQHQWKADSTRQYRCATARRIQEERWWIRGRLNMSVGLSSKSGRLTNLLARRSWKRRGKFSPCKTISCQWSRDRVWSARSS